jgi:hypothetical protein
VQCDNLNGIYVVKFTFDGTSWGNLEITSPLIKVYHIALDISSLFALKQGSCPIVTLKITIAGKIVY